MIAPGAGRRLLYGLDDLVLGTFAVPKVSTMIERGLGNADGVGKFDFAAVGKAGGDHVLGDPARGIRGGAVNLGAVLAAKGTAAVTAVAAVGVDDDLAAGEARVAHGAAHDKATGGVHVDVCVVPRHVLGVHDRGDDVLDEVGLDLAHVLDLGGVLRGDDDGRYLDGLAVLNVRTVTWVLPSGRR